MDIFKFFDIYELKARGLPVLLVVMPILFLGMMLKVVDLHDTKSLFWTFVALIIMYVAAKLVRYKGKIIEKKIFDKHGGWPSTIIQRHSSTDLDVISKKRLHEFLERKIDQKYPDDNYEATHPEESDIIYNSGTAWLLSNTRDNTRFNILFSENISYGFIRNCLGIKKFAILILSLSVGIYFYNLLELASWEFDNVELSFLSYTFLSFNLFLLLFWSFYVVEAKVIEQGYIYAKELLKCCDSLN